MCGTRKKAKLMEMTNMINLMNRKEALNRFNNIWRHGTTSIDELRIVMNRIKDS